jgi:predicted ABC-type transport system involved in lysophospholipase L1 biosynthesis ATPase subunit
MPVCASCGGAVGGCGEDRQYDERDGEYGDGKKRAHRSGRVASVPTMTERESREVERILLHVSDARSRTHDAAERLGKDGGAEHVVEALRSAEQQLATLHRSLSQATYYAVSNDDPQTTVDASASRRAAPGSRDRGRLP